MKAFFYLAWLLSVAFATLSIGCGKPAGSGNAPNVTAGLSKTLPAVGREIVMDDLRQIGIFYQAHLAVNRQGPAKLEDWQDLKKDSPKLYQALEEGRYVVIWNANPKVLAYEKDAPTKGGVVLLRDGSVKNMSLAEFQAATKAQEK